MPIYVLGLGGPANLEGSLVPLLVTLFGTVWGFFIHANVRWRFGPLEWLISTPAFHHWHHTKTGPIDVNYSSNLPCLDWMFGSLYLPNEWPDDYGIKAKMPGALVDQLVYPLFPPPLTVEPAEPTPTDAVDASPSPAVSAREPVAQVGKVVADRRLLMCRACCPAGPSTLPSAFAGTARRFFTFVTTPDVEPTNNRAEQAIRFVVIDRHITQGTRSAAGRRWSERIWTTIATCAGQGRSLYGYLQECVGNWFEGRPSPSLLPSGTRA